MRIALSAILTAMSLAFCAAGAAAQITQSYSYDVQGQLIGVGRSTGDTVEYQYDAAGNRTQVVVQNGYLNGDFANGMAGWQTYSWQAPNAQAGVNNTPYWGNGNNVLWSYIPGSPSNALVDLRSSWMTVAGGRAYDISVYAAQHRGTAAALVEFYAADQTTLISSEGLQGVAREGGAAAGDLANFNLLGTIAVAPAGAVYSRLNLRLASNGGVDPFAFFTRPTSSPEALKQDVLNPKFRYGMKRWQLATLNAGSYAFGLDNPGWWGNDNDVFWMYVPGVPQSALMDFRSDFMISEPGAIYEASIAAAQHRGTAQLLMEFYAADRTTVLAQVGLPGAGFELGGANGDPSLFNIVGGFATAPAGTAYRRLNLRLASNGGSDPFAFFMRPISRRASPGQQQLTTWSSLYGP